MDFELKDSYQIDDLLRIMELLRKYCPWDREQTHQSIRTNFIEEVYEAAEAIDTNNVKLMKEELGDVLLQVLFHTEMEKEQGNFTFNEVCDGISKKLIERHPHIFGDVQADTVEKVLDNWNSIKMEQKGQDTYTQNLKGVSKSLPALMRAEKVQGRAKKAGLPMDDFFKTDDIHQNGQKLQKAVSMENTQKIQNAVGQILFQLANCARINNLDPEYCLEQYTDRFIDRFSVLEGKCIHKNIDMRKAESKQILQIWEEATNEKIELDVN